MKKTETDDLTMLNVDDLKLTKQLFLALNTGLPFSAAVERLFSLGGRILSPTCTLLTDEHFEMLVFLKANRALIHA